MEAWQPALARLVETWPAPPWSWDARLVAVAATFATTQEPSVRTSAVHAFPRGWTTKSLDAAPPELRAIADRTGGLRAGQRLLGGDAGLYGLWWPWGGGDKITLRIGLAGHAADAPPFAELRALFGVALAA